MSWVTPDTPMEDGISSACEPLQKEGIYARHVHWFLIPAFGAIITLSFLEKRKSYKLTSCGGRPGAVRPMSFLYEPSNRWGLMLVLGSVAGSVVRVTLKTFSAEFPIWAKVFLIYLLSLETTMICYPLFACMTCRHKLVGSILGLCYSTGWLAFQLFANIQTWTCYTDVGGGAMGLSEFVAAIPVMICAALVVLKFAHKLYKYVKGGPDTYTAEEQCKLCEDHHLVYVKFLLSPKQQPPTASGNTQPLAERVTSYFMTQVPGFRFPVHIVGTAFVGLIMLYMIIAEVLVLLLEMDAGNYTVIMKVSIVIASIATLCVGLRNLYQLLLHYRRDLLRLYKGKRDFIPANVLSPSPNTYMARGMRYIGTAIAGMLWGTLICLIVVFLPLFMVLITFKELINQDKVGDLLKQLQWLIYPACMIIVFQVQTRLIGWFLLQDKIKETDKYRPLAVNNRNVYDILSFFMIFLNACIGVFAFLRRILVGSLLGVFLIPRMDRSLFMRGFEPMDKCYLNYIGMLMVDLHHSHPVMRVFCSLVKEAAAERLEQGQLIPTVENPTYGTVRNVNVTVTSSQRKALVRRRWFVAYTLIRNPRLVSARKSQLPAIQIEIDDRAHDTSQGGSYIRLERQEETSAKAGVWRLNCSKHRFTIPPNFSTNVATMLVLLAIAMVVVALPLIVGDGLSQFGI